MTKWPPASLRRTLLAALLLSALSCLDGPTEPVILDIVTATPEALSLFPLDTAVVQVRVETPQGVVVTDKLLAWQSLDTTIATVTQSGVVTARLHTGASARYVSLVVGALRARADTVPVEVRPWAVARVVAADDTVRIAPLAVDTLTARPEAANGTALTGRDVLWLSSDTTVVRVGQDGIVRASAYTGVTDRPVYVVVYSGGLADTIAVIATALRASSIAIAPDTVERPPSDSARFSVALRAGNVTLTGAPFVWSSSDTGVATVNAEGAVITRYYVGPAVRTTRVTASVGALVDTAVVVVRPHPTRTISLFPGTELLSPNRTVQVDAILRDSTGRFLEGRPITWTSSDTVVATVSASGLVLTRRVGAATITARSGSASATMQLTVVHPVTQVRVTPRLSTVWIGRTQAFATTLKDSVDVVLTDRLVTWRSSDASRATVDADGVVTGVGTGAVTITASVEGLADSVRIDVFAVPSAAITITFDDAWRGVLELAAPILDSLRVRANVGWLTNVDWAGVMVPAELRVLQEKGWSIVSHSMTHPYLTRLTADSVARELTGSRTRIASLGFDPRVFIAPYLDHNDAVLAASAVAGYTYTRCCAQDVWTTDTLVSWPIASGARHRLAGVDVTNYEGNVTTYNFHTAGGRTALRALLESVVARGKFIDVFFHNIVPADVADLRVTLELLAEFRPYLITYGMLP